MFSPKFSDIISALLVLLFLYTGLSKLMDHTLFHIQLAESPWKLLSGNAKWFSYALPIGEIVLAMALIIPKSRLLGYWTSVILLTAFIIYLSILLTSGVHLPCSCGGIIALLSWKQHLIFNILFAAFAVWGILIEKRNHIRQIQQ